MEGVAKKVSDIKEKTQATTRVPSRFKSTTILNLKPQITWLFRLMPMSPLIDSATCLLIQPTVHDSCMMPYEVAKAKLFFNLAYSIFPFNASDIS